jgi:hypothetical protein
MLTEAEKGWMAGILDFQGHIVRKTNHSRARGSVQLVLYVETKHAAIIRRLCESTGTAVEAHEQHPLKEEWKRKGCTDHCPEAHIHMQSVNMPSMYRWTVTGVALAVVLHNLRVYLRTEDEPWDWALETCIAQATLSGRGSGAVMAALRRLRDLGWELPEKLVRPDLAAGETEQAGEARADQAAV